jgi:hypothetical protein
MNEDKDSPEIKRPETKIYKNTDVKNLSSGKLKILAFATLLLGIVASILFFLQASHKPISQNQPSQQLSTPIVPEQPYTPKTPDMPSQPFGPLKTEANDTTTKRR